MRKTDPRQALESRLKLRRKKTFPYLKDACLIIPSAEAKNLSRDQEHPYHQNSDLLYLTGHKEPSSILVIKPNHSPKTILYLKDRNKEEEKWLGESLGLSRARRRFQIDDIRDISSFKTDLPQLLHGCNTLFYPLGVNSDIDHSIIKALSHPNNPRFNFPTELKDSRLITSELRLIKDKEEIKSLKLASEITAKSLRQLTPYLSTFKSEKHCASELETLFIKNGAHGISFKTIVAIGKNSTVLHHTPNYSPLFKRDLVLIDCGAEFNGYAGDITRVFPVSGKFSDIQAEVYDIVKEALYDSLLKAKAGNSLDDIHLCAVKTLTKGLISLGVIKNSLSQAISKGEYKKFFMHRTSHWLGLDVHDISPVTYQNSMVHSYLRPLEPGMCFTIEPGLYFENNDSEIPAELRGIGIRLEDDILITNKGHDVLSKSIPLDRNEIEKLF